MVDGEIYENIFERGGVEVYSDGATNRWSVYNNVFYNTAPNPGGDDFAFLARQSLAFRFYNNIIYDTANSDISHRCGSSVGVNIAEHNYNLYYPGMQIQINVYCSNPATYGSLSTWQSATGWDGNSLETDPLFVSLGTNFNLQAGSPARSSGKTGLDMGAYPRRDSTVIGQRTTTTDTEAPSVPQGLTSTAKTSTSVTLTWLPSTDNVGVTSYRVFRGGTEVGTPGTPPFTNTGLTQNTTYSFTVSARDVAGNESAQSSAVSVTTDPTDTAAPSQPQNLRQTGQSATSIDLAWNASTDNVGVTGYRVYRAAALIASPTATSYVDTGLTVATTYTYEVSAIDAAGNESAKSAAISGTTNLAPPTTFLPASDATMDAGTPTSNYSTIADLWLFTWPANEVANASILQFNLSSVPAGTTVIAATLKLFLREADATADPLYRAPVHKIINVNPVLTQVTSNVYATGSGWTANASRADGIPIAQADIDPAVDTPLINKTLEYKSWNVTSIVKDWLATPSQNYGLLINGDSTLGVDRYRYFYSRDATDATRWPVLEIFYSEGGVAPNSPGRPSVSSRPPVTDRPAVTSRPAL